MFRFIIFGVGILGMLIILILMVKESIKIKKQKKVIKDLNVPELLEHAELNLNEFLKGDTDETDRM